MDAEANQKPAATIANIAEASSAYWSGLRPFRIKDVMKFIGAFGSCFLLEISRKTDQWAHATMVAAAQSSDAWSQSEIQGAFACRKFDAGLLEYALDPGSCHKVDLLIASQLRLDESLVGNLHSSGQQMSVPPEQSASLSYL